ncbi:MAG: hypothetical protein ACTHJ8_09590 [Mucilaginibacter sp.]
METQKTNLGNIKEMLTKDQMKKVRGGTGYMCCWSGTSNCSTCVSSAQSNWTCVSGASLTAC